MNIPIYVAFISAIASVFAAALTFWFTKFKEREAEVRKQKLEPSVERHHILLKELILAIRSDLGLAKKDDREKLSFHLWCSGANG